MKKLIPFLILVGCIVTASSASLFFACAESARDAARRTLKANQDEENVKQFLRDHNMR